MVSSLPKWQLERSRLERCGAKACSPADKAEYITTSCEGKCCGSGHVRKDQTIPQVGAASISTFFASENYKPGGEKWCGEQDLNLHSLSAISA
jgi:hypothetical protein